MNKPINFILLLVTLFYALPSYSAFPATRNPKYDWQTGCTRNFTTVDAVCAQSTRTSCQGVGSCQSCPTGNKKYLNCGLSNPATYSCKENSTLISGTNQCQCNAPTYQERYNSVTQTYSCNSTSFNQAEAITGLITLGLGLQTAIANGLLNGITACGANIACSIPAAIAFIGAGLLIDGLFSDSSGSPSNYVTVTLGNASASANTGNFTSTGALQAPTNATYNGVTGTWSSTTGNGATGTWDEATSTVTSTYTNGETTYSTKMVGQSNGTVKVITGSSSPISTAGTNRLPGITVKITVGNLTPGNPPTYNQESESIQYCYGSECQLTPRENEGEEPEEGGCGGQGGVACDSTLQELLLTMQGVGTNGASASILAKQTFNANMAGAPNLTQAGNDTRAKLSDDPDFSETLDGVSDFHPINFLEASNSFGNCIPYDLPIYGTDYSLDICDQIHHVHNAIEFFLFITVAMSMFNLFTERPE